MKMSKIRIYVIEDSPEYHAALKFEMEPQLIAMGITPYFTFAKNGDTLQQDLVAGVDILLVDDDLGGTYGDEIIQEIDTFPEYKNLKIIYYSGGETLENLIIKTRKWGLICSTKSTLGAKLKSCCEQLLK
jgi:response regulator RpfG family c-di-GMP phosphodiesterase